VIFSLKTRLSPWGTWRLSATNAVTSNPRRSAVEEAVTLGPPLTLDLILVDTPRDQTPLLSNMRRPLQRAYTGDFARRQRGSPHDARTTCCDRGYGRPSGRPRVLLRQAQDKLTLRRTVKYASSPSPCGCPARDASACAARGTTIFTISRRRPVHNAG
jgi:hypothetical protein